MTEHTTDLLKAIENGAVTLIKSVGYVEEGPDCEFCGEEDIPQVLNYMRKTCCDLLDLIQAYEKEEGYI
uniref:Uncharacterized protein n=1 Tax=viral metagenome TaxID=1070528 RepID=A0A6M3L4K9_9ZZZZ